MAGDIIYYPNWQCLGTGKIVHYTKKAGSHTLRFEFGDQIAYAYNNPGIIDNLVSYWKLDEGSGNAVDSHSAHNGTPTGVAYSQAGKINTSFGFGSSIRKLPLYFDLRKLGFAPTASITCFKLSSQLFWWAGS